MEKWKLRALDLLIGLAFTGEAHPEVIPYTPAKLTASAYEEPFFKRSAPEKHGVDEDTLCDMLTELEAEERAKIHSLLVLADGEVICECSAPGYSVNIRHLAHSMSKTVTGMAIGMLFDDGALDLDTPIVKIFPEYTPKDKKFSMITVRHLLTMSSGVSISELGTVTEDKWLKAFFESKVEFTPGTEFAYNSMNSYVLAAIVVKISGMSLTDFLTSRLFSPLGITNFLLEVGPEGIEKGGFGMHLSAESFAKLGMLMLSKGSFEGKRILSEHWVALATASHSVAPSSSGDYNYGFQLWVGRDGSEFLFNGMLGQNVLVMPERNIIAVINSENNELFGDSPALKIIKKHLSRERGENRSGANLKLKEKNFFKTRMKAAPLPKKSGISYLLGFKNPKPFDERWNSILGKYNVEKNNHGILPLFIRLLQNNYGGGIKAIEVLPADSSIIFKVYEESNTYVIRAGLYGYESSIINYNGEKYIVRALAERCPGEHGENIFKIELIFPEMPNSRLITMKKDSDGTLLINLSENPDQKIAEPLIESIYITNPKLSFAVGLLERRLGDRFIQRKLEKLFRPTLRGVNAEADEGKLEAINRELETAEGETKMLADLLIKIADDE